MYIKMPEFASRYGMKSIQDVTWSWEVLQLMCSFVGRNEWLLEGVTQKPGRTFVSLNTA